MRIGVNTLFMIPGEVGGSETYLRQVLSAIAAGQEDVQLVLFTNCENEAPLRKLLSPTANAEFVPLRLRASNRYLRILREQTELPLKVRRAGVDVLWSPGYTCPFLSDCPQVVSLLDMQYKSHPEDLGCLARITTDLLVRMAAARCARIVTISEFARDEVLRHTSAARDRIDVTPLGVDPAFGEVDSRSAAAETLRRLIGHSEPYILVVSNTYPHKNVQAAVAAFGDIMDEVPHRLVLVGKPRLGEALVARARAAVQNPARITRLEYVESWRDLVTLYQGADAFVFPSLYEGFGLPVLEAMMAGVPVVSTRMASIPEVGGDSIVYFDNALPGDLATRIRAVLGWTPAERERQTARARKLAAGFTWQNTARGTLAALRAAAGNTVGSHSPRKHAKKASFLCRKSLDNIIPPHRRPNGL